MCFSLFGGSRRIIAFVPDSSQLSNRRCAVERQGGKHLFQSRLTSFFFLMRTKIVNRYILLLWHFKKLFHSINNTLDRFANKYLWPDDFYCVNNSVSILQEVVIVNLYIFSWPSLRHFEKEGHGHDTSLTFLIMMPKKISKDMTSQSGRTPSRKIHSALRNTTMFYWMKKRK